jgi:hypothetical protein
MTTKPPPVYYFDGITFNSGYYKISEEATLTQSQADSRYLIKAISDTINYLQKVLGGIQCGLSSVYAHIGSFSGITTNNIDIGTPLGAFSLLSNHKCIYYINDGMIHQTIN